MANRISELLEHDHEQLSEVLAQLRDAIGRQDQNHAFLLLDLFWARLAMHIRAENVHLFPALHRAVPAANAAGMPTADEVKSAVDRLKSDHNFYMDQLSRAVKTMRGLNSAEREPAQLVDAFAEVLDRVNAVAASLTAHNELEEEQVYKWPELMLSHEELENLGVQLKHEIENMPPRFDHS
jgi:iron-sulfur cluster repair protein YtfE (RIC family)